MPKSKGRRKPKRQTPPAPPPRKDTKVSPVWYAALMFSLMGVGVMLIVVNYIGVIGGDFNRVFLWGGLAMIGAGFMMTLNYH